jgi:hypothetical protein
MEPSTNRGGTAQTARPRSTGRCASVNASQTTLKRLGPGLYESRDGRYEISHEVYWLEGECSCLYCQGYMYRAGGCPNDGCAKREGWHIWDRQAENYASFAPEPQMFERFRDAKAHLLEHLR